MPFIVIIDKHGNVSEKQVPPLIDTLYKEVGLKDGKNFKLQHKWTAENIAIFGQTEGRAGQENKYELPPPIDSVLYFGSIALIRYEGNVAQNLRKKEWEDIYSRLMGGFIECSEEDEDDEDDDEDEAIGKHGYALDGFVVD